MSKIEIPYYKSKWTIEICDENLAGILEPKVKDYKTDLKEEEIINKALDNPIGSPKLEELVKDKKNMIIITSDHTRPVPSKITMPILLKRIRNSNPEIEIKILVATGLHRATSKDELINKFGSEIFESENIIIHDANDSRNLVRVGILPSGGEAWINKAAMETELLIVEGLIKPHPMAGFSGGRKSVLPGIAGAQTVLANHCSEFVASDYARTGKLENNPIHMDMLYAAKKAKVTFTLNVIINNKKKAINAFAGDLEKAHLAGCNFIRGISEVDNVKADIVIASNGGYPADQNLYQLGKGMETAESVCNEGGVIIMIASCCDGHGGQDFFDNLANANSPKEIYDRVLKVAKNETAFDQWAYQIFARVLCKFKVILVTDMCDPKLVKAVHLEHAFTFEEALTRAYEIKGKDAKVTVIPSGGSVIIK